MTKKEYPEGAVERAKDGALEWLRENVDGYPRSWQQEAACNARRGYDMYDKFEAPPIAGYEELEREGTVIRLETVFRSDDEERIHFRLQINAHKRGAAGQNEV